MPDPNQLRKLIALECTGVSFLVSWFHIGSTDTQHLSIGTMQTFGHKHVSEFCSYGLLSASWCGKARQNTPSEQTINM